MQSLLSLLEPSFLNYISSCLLQLTGLKRISEPLHKDKSIDCFWGTSVNGNPLRWISRFTTDCFMAVSWLNIEWVTSLYMKQCDRIQEEKQEQQKAIWDKSSMFNHISLSIEINWVLLYSFQSTNNMNVAHSHRFLSIKLSNQGCFFYSSRNQLV